MRIAFRRTRRYRCQLGTHCSTVSGRVPRPRRHADGRRGLLPRPGAGRRLSRRRRRPAPAESSAASGSSSSPTRAASGAATSRRTISSACKPNCSANSATPDLLDAVYHCPDAPDHATERRKPGAGMILEAARDHGLDLARSYMIGDSDRDIESGRRAGLAGNVLVLTGKGREHRARCQPDFVAANLIGSGRLDSATRGTPRNPWVKSSASSPRAGRPRGFPARCSTPSRASR